ncbi:MAG: hypothetical protein ABIL62_18580 [Planctomycetota bacterium]
MAGRLASQATGAFDAAMNGGPGISMCVLQSAPTANPRIGTGQGRKGRIMPTVSKKMCSAQKRPHRQMGLFDDNGGT